MKKQIILIVLSSIFLFSIHDASTEVTLTDKEYQAVINRLKKDKIIIHNNNVRWARLKKSKPKIDYEVKDNKIVIQKIEIPIYRAKPLIYKVEFEIVNKKNKEKFFPMYLLLCGMVETEVLTDFKAGVQLFSLAPLHKYLKIGINVLAGIKSAGGSLSYTLPKPLANTSIHFYAGVNYLKVKPVYGIGISLNF